MLFSSIHLAFACSSKYASTIFSTLFLPYLRCNAAFSSSLPLTYLSMILEAWLKTQRDFVP